MRRVRVLSPCAAGLARTRQAPPTRAHGAPCGLKASDARRQCSPVVTVGDTATVPGIPAGIDGSDGAKARHRVKALEAPRARAGATLADVVGITMFHARSRSSEELQADFECFAVLHRQACPDHSRHGRRSA